jgi:hypothetical protein
MSRTRDLTGMVFGRWTVICRTENAPNGSSQWHCRCTCGTERSVQGKRLVSGSTVSCGCFQAEMISIIMTRDLAVGQKFGAWEVVAFDKVKGGKAHWLCRCRCGTTRSVNGANLRSGRTRSCGECNSS